MNDELRKNIRRAAQALRTEGAREVYLFGSATTGRLREDSDIDFAVSGLPPEKYFQAISAAQNALGSKHELDLIDLDENNPFTRYLKEEREIQRVA